MGLCDIFSSRRSQRPLTTSDISFEICLESSREGDRLREERRALRRAKIKVEDEAARLRALTFVPPIQVIKGAHHDFMEVGSFEGEPILAPIPMIVAVTMGLLRAGPYGPERDGPSTIRAIVIEMVSGLKHHVRVEGASADIMLAAIRQAWKAEPSHD